MVSKMIDFGFGVMPRGFSKRLGNCFNLTTIDMYATPDLIDKVLPSFLSEDKYILVRAKGKKLVNNHELGGFLLLDAIFSEGDYFHSFYIAKNTFTNVNGKRVKLIALLYEERGNIHIWNPAFEELFLPLILDDVKKGASSHWKSLQEIHQNRHQDLDVYEIALRNQVDYEIGLDKGEFFTTVVYYALMKYIFLVEDEKYPDIPGSNRTIKAYKDLYNDHLNDCVDMMSWRRKHKLKDPWV